MTRPYVFCHMMTSLDGKIIGNYMRTPEADAAPVPDGDFVAVSDASKYYISIDPSGRLGWDSAEMTYRTTTAHVIEVLTGRASNAYMAFLYMAFLRKLGISYLIAGDTNIDFELLLDKLPDLFDVQTLMLGGGGVLNWSFIQANLCDELSVVIAPTADGSSDTPATTANTATSPSTQESRGRRAVRGSLLPQEACFS